MTSPFLTVVKCMLEGSEYNVLLANSAEVALRLVPPQISGLQAIRDGGAEGRLLTARWLSYPLYASLL